MDGLIAFNRPYGVIYQFSEHEEHPCLKGCADRPGFHPAGRLDTDSEGLLLLTDNGVFQAQITGPGFKWEKTHWTQVEDSPDEEKLDLLCNGVGLGGFVAHPTKIRLLETGEADILWPRNPPVRIHKAVPDFWLEIRTTEGKNRQVRRMTAKAGYPYPRLVRVTVDRLNVFDLGLGLSEWRLTPFRLQRTYSDSFLMREAV